MNNSKLKSWVNGLVVLFTLVIFITACNNSDQSANSSTDTAANAAVDTSSGRMSDTSTNKNTGGTTTTKKRGRATVSAIAENKNAKIQADKSGVYEMSEVRPAYPGGQSELENYITNNIEYPQTAVDNSREGTVNVQFTVDENGNVSNAKVLGNKLGDGLDEEAVRVISKMPKWTAGSVKGKNVKTRLTLPITFKIEE
jgi:protein TonB